MCSWCEKCLTEGCSFLGEWLDVTVANLSTANSDISQTSTQSEGKDAVVSDEERRNPYDTLAEHFNTALAINEG